MVPFERVLFALGIRYVGETVAKKVARAAGSLENLLALNRDDLLKIEEVGEKIADSILNYFGQAKNLQLIRKLQDAGLQFSVEGNYASPGQGVLNDMTFVITGVFSRFSRDRIKDMIAMNGGKTTGSVSVKTAFLVAGTSPGPEKIKKAEQLGIQIINEDELLEMIALAGDLPPVN
jgi:DNA ligase (NAD+)